MNGPRVEGANASHMEDQGQIVIQCHRLFGKLVSSSLGGDGRIVRDSVLGSRDTYVGYSGYDVH